MMRLLMYFFPGVFIKFLKGKFYQRLQFIKEYEKMQQRINKSTFIRERLKDMREDIRRQYDKINEELDAIKIARERNEKLEDPDKTIRENLDKAEESKKKDIEQLKLQIDQLDKQINEPGGVEDTIVSYRAILPLIERLIKQ